MAPPRSYSIRLIASLLFINLFVYLLAGLSLYQIRQQYETQTSLSTQNLARSLETSVSGILDKINVALGAVVYEAERELLAGGIDNAALSAYIARQHTQLPELDSIRTTDAHGIVRHDSDLPSGVTAKLADRDYFRFLANHPDAGMVVSKPLLGRISGKWLIIVARRINAADGSFAGVAYGGLTLDYFTRLFASFDVGEHGSIGLRDEEMASVARYPEPGGSGSVTGNRQVSTTLLNNVKAHPASGTYSALATYDKIVRTITYRKVSHYPLYILVGQATGDYLAPWRKEVAVTLALAALFSLLTGIAAWLIYRDVAERMRSEEALHLQTVELEEEVAERQMAQENLQEKAQLLEEEIEKRQQTEDDLKKLNEQLELRVLERTADLEEKNAELYKMNRIFVGRELRMVELKKRIKELEELSRGTDLRN